MKLNLLFLVGAAIVFQLCYLSTPAEAFTGFTNILAPPHIHGKFAYVTWTKEKGYEIKIFAVGFTGEDPSNLDWVAKARFQNMVNKTGWGFLEVETRSSWPDEMQAFAAGMAEGYLTRDLIYYTWKNLIEHYCDDKPVVCKYVNKFISQNLAWMEKNIQANKDNVPYWHQVNLLKQQFSGLTSGFRLAANGTGMVITDLDFLYINLYVDLGDLEAALNPDPKARAQLFKNEGHCSALIKIVEDRDIYFSHVTWANLSTMLRIVKRYNFPYKTLPDKKSHTVPAQSISMSSYPGMLHSMDDFYLTTSGLAVMETTIENYNDNLWGNISSVNSLFAGVRTMVANRLARNGQMWTKLFSRYNSGTYNNQWMVLNYNNFEPGRPIKEGLLWVLEQLPGMVTAKDLTSVLKNKGYWASYNLPYFKEIFDASGGPKMVQKFGDFFGHETSPRAKIFARDQGDVEDFESMMKLMRYNDYTNDEFSKCACNPPYSAVNAISARGDLNPANGTYPFKLLGHRSSAATDMKFTTLDMFLLQQFLAIGGPTYDPLPPFEWSTSSEKDRPHHGMPDRYEFEPIIHHWKWL